MIVSGPDIISRGFVYVRENEDLIGEATRLVANIMDNSARTSNSDWTSMKNAVRDGLRRFIYDKTKRNPVILPIFMEV